MVQLLLKLFRILHLEPALVRNQKGEVKECLPKPEQNEFRTISAQKCYLCKGTGVITDGSSKDPEIFQTPTENWYHCDLSCFNRIPYSTTCPICSGKGIINNSFNP